MESLYRFYEEAYTYSTIGNLLSKNGVSYTYGSAKPHAVTQAGAKTYAYDANGNMTQRGSQTLTWDVENRLTQVDDGGTLAAFVYDGDGTRVKKVEGGETTHYVNRYYEKNVTTGEETLYYYHGGRLVAVKKGGTLEYVHQDHLGSTALTTDASGTLASSELYFPYGTTRELAGTLPTERRFTGQRLDGGKGLYFYQAPQLESGSIALRTAPLTVTHIYNGRPYDPALGRFIQADAIVPDASNPQTLNRYAYVTNNPTTYDDPDGHCLPFCFAAVVAVVKVSFALYDAYHAYQTFTDPNASTLDKALAGGDVALDVVGPGKWLRKGGGFVLGLVGKGGREAKGAYKIAKEGGKHAGLITRYSHSRTSEIRSHRIKAAEGG